MSGRLVLALVFTFVIVSVLAVVIGGTGTTDPGPPTGEWADPGRTANLVEADYDRRGIDHELVACESVDADSQRCEVFNDGDRIALLDVRLDLVAQTATWGRP